MYDAVHREPSNPRAARSCIAVAVYVVDDVAAGVLLLIGHLRIVRSSRRVVRQVWVLIGTRCAAA